MAPENPTIKELKNIRNSSIGLLKDRTASDVPLQVFEKCRNRLYEVAIDGRGNLCAADPQRLEIAALRSQ